MATQPLSRVCRAWQETRPVLKPHHPRAVLIAVKLPGISDAEHASSLDELARLVSTLGYDVEARLVQARAKLASGAVIGEGKLLELGELTGGTGRVGSAAPKPKDKARQRRAAAAEEASELSSGQLRSSRRSRDLCELRVIGSL